MIQFPDIFKCVVSPRELVFPRTKLTGGEWLEAGATATFGVFPSTKEEHDAIWEFLRRTDGEGENFIYKTDLHDTEGDTEHLWRMVKVEPIPDHGSRTEIKFTAQIVGVLGDKDYATCDGGYVLCGGERVVAGYSIDSTYPRRV